MSPQRRSFDYCKNKTCRAPLDSWPGSSLPPRHLDDMRDRHHEAIPGGKPRPLFAHEKERHEQEQRVEFGVVSYAEQPCPCSACNHKRLIEAGIRHGSRDLQRYEEGL